ncbi:hypothetical protein L6164_026183 [Bauhinia variegata]|uniref:Uncharacterized protein n=1 Tax=Bauhinia variegata TaxID=167791 RepID=A0ACB9LPA9_BAUVA|nr:hypothetical protein L6164_026183 [Bauhinia variegata]
MNWRSKKEKGVKNNKTDRDEVEELLQAAQDQVLLNLSVNSHIVSSSTSSNNYLDGDLDRRFQALKSSKPSIQTQIPIVDRESKDALGDDLSARFAGLKVKNSSSTSSSALAKELGLGGGPTLDSTVQEEDDEVDQVEKLIQWAKDAARLDPSPPSDDDNDSDDKDDGDDEDDSLDEGRDTKRGEKRK